MLRNPLVSPLLHPLRRGVKQRRPSLPTQLAGLMALLFGNSEPGLHYEAYNPDSIVRRRNFAYASEDLTVTTANMGWNKTNLNASITTGVASYDGLPIAQTITENSSAGQHVYLSNSTWLTNDGNDVVFEGEFKYAGRRIQLFVCNAGFTNAFSLIVDLQTGANVLQTTHGSGATFVSANIVALANGYYRVTARGRLATTDTTIRFAVYFVNTGTNTTYTGDGVSGVTATRHKLMRGAAYDSDSSYQKVTDWNTEFIAQGGSLVALYQDSVGTLACTTREDPVGLILDRRFLGVRGADLKATGAVGLIGAATVATYNTSTGAGTATRVDASNRSYVQFSALTATAMHEVVVTNTGAVTLNVRNSADTSVATVAAGASAPVKLVAGVSIRLDAAAAGTATFTVSSLREIPGTHATQSTSTMRALLTGRVNILLATTTLATQSVTTLAASYKLSFTGTGTVTLTGTSTAGPLVGTGANDRVSLTFTPTAGSLTLTVSGSVTLADLRLTDDAAKNIPAYQYVNTATDYDGEGFPWRLKFDGVDDFYTGTLDLSATNKLTLFAGVEKRIETVGGAVVIEHSVTSVSNPGTFELLAPASTLNDFYWRSAGTVVSNAVSAGVYTAPTTKIVTGVGDIAGDIAQLSLNGAVVTTSATDQGTGNYGNYPFYIGARAGTSLRFSGALHSITVRGAATGPALISAMERYAKTLAALTY